MGKKAAIVENAFGTVVNVAQLLFAALIGVALLVAVHGWVYKLAGIGFLIYAGWVLFVTVRNWRLALQE